MATQFEQRLALLGSKEIKPLLNQIQRGIEKESLRMDPEGRLAQTPHPAAFGSALTHPSITTDFSEALLEFITPVSNSIEGSLATLAGIHRFAAQKLDSEQLWNASMPCRLGEEQDIPIGLYGSSHSATMKTRYRLGLSHRYGRKMQTIAGIHYNFSLPETLWQALKLNDADPNCEQDFITCGYFNLIRNFRRYAWLLIYLFGAAPAVSRCFLNGRPHGLEDWDEHTLYGPYATSLRMGDLGYSSVAQKNLKICYNKLENYIDTLCGAITTPHAGYENIPADEQLSTGLLQIENEFYSPIRPKRVTKSGEIPLGALKRAGVEYVEVRCVDINPLLPMGIDSTQIRFLDSFLLFCLCQPSPACDADDIAEITANFAEVVSRGRQPGLQLQRAGESIAMQAWGTELLEQINQVAAILDDSHDGSAYRDSCSLQKLKLEDPEQTPSAQVLSIMRHNKESFFHFAYRQSSEMTDYFREQPLSPQELEKFAAEREQSLVDQAAIEADSTGNFEDYLAAFFQQYQEL
ncbi:glutamate--cysteine ligase [Spongiibacter sp. KMU-158]|uniref:Glutamate--cysteine ligase n=1 Tax=Spongiibacter pelagi TaxID=2760804 RepID=A0A927BZ26_9GAMM|nr:glutamate--cysteine ligase [Spongiibacter pelagi]MBD2857664.1 glutamate--cysteine ligase [Spongiibacter pelagi]